MSCACWKGYELTLPLPQLPFYSVLSAKLVQYKVDTFIYFLSSLFQWTTCNDPYLNKLVGLFWCHKVGFFLGPTSLKHRLQETSHSLRACLLRGVWKMVAHSLYFLQHRLPWTFHCLMACLWLGGWRMVQGCLYLAPPLPVFWSEDHTPLFPAVVLAWYREDNCWMRLCHQNFSRYKKGSGMPSPEPFLLRWQLY